MEEEGRPMSTGDIEVEFEVDVVLGVGVGVGGKIEVEAVVGVGGKIEVEAVVGIGVEAGPTEQHNCCRALVRRFQGKPGKRRDTLVWLGKQVCAECSEKKKQECGGFEERV
ncbi:hypothetical protein CsSME_00017656 [Camellia sinensis var. sinensis]